jgi:AcrR family transcriptional regulator
MRPESPASLREQHAEFTRDAILRALAQLLEVENPGDIAMPDVARKAGVALRTVYRYFTTREELLAAAADWLNEQRFGGVPFGDTVDEIPRIFRQACERWDEHPQLVRAMALSQAGRRVRSHRRVQRLAALRRALVAVTDRLPKREQRQAFAVLAYLENMLAWVTMRDEGGLTSREAGEAVEWAMRTLIDDLRRRNAAAGRAKGGT